MDPDTLASPATHDTVGGLTIRDYAAIKIVAALVGRELGGFPREFAQKAYELADALIEESKKPRKET